MEKKSNNENIKRIMGRYFLFFIFSLLVVTFVFPLHVFAQNPTNIEKLVQSNTQFAIDMYEQIKTEKGNLFFSPYSISTVLALLYGGAREETAEQIADIIHLSLGDKKLHNAFREIQTRLNVIQQKGNIELHTANSLWPQDKYPFLKKYLELAKKYYQTEITPVDYKTGSEASREKINLWVEEKTNNKIQDLIRDRLLDQKTVLVIVNAIYFKGEWASKYNKADTTNMPFYPDKSVKIEVPMMHQKNKLNYGEDGIVQVLEMPYAGNDLSMLVVLPMEIDGLQQLEEILTAERLKKWNNNLSNNIVDVYFPRFTMTFELNLQETIKAMGMKSAFVYRKANFSGMDGNPDLIYISFFLHKAFVNVNEEGTEAAAAVESRTIF
jgi:serpin B